MDLRTDVGANERWRRPWRVDRLMIAVGTCGRSLANYVVTWAVLAFTIALTPGIYPDEWWSVPLAALLFSLCAPFAQSLLAWLASFLRLGGGDLARHLRQRGRHRHHPEPDAGHGGRQLLGDAAGVLDLRA